MENNIQSGICNKKICVDDLFDAYSCYQVIKDESGEPVDAVIVSVNCECEKILGKKREELIGTSISELLSRERVLLWVQIYKKIQAADKRTNYSFYSDFAGRMFNTKIFIDEEENVNVIYHDDSELQTTNIRYSEAEEKYRAMIENSPNIILRFNRDCRHIFANTAARKQAGLGPEGFNGRTHADMELPEDLREYWESKIKDVFEKKEAVRENYKFGELVYDWSLIPEFNANHEVSTVLSISRDITEIIAKTKALEESENRYRFLLESIPASVAVIDFDYRLTVINDVNASFAVKPKEQLIGSKIEDAFPMLKWGGVLDTCRQVMETRIPKAKIVEMILADGQPRWYEDHIFPVPEGIMVIGADITKRKIAEELLLESEEKFRTLIEQSTDGIILIDTQGCLKEFNKGMENITGLKREEAIGRHVVDLLLQLMPDDLKTTDRCNNIKRKVEELCSTECKGIEDKIYEGTIECLNGTRKNIQDLFYKFKVKDNFYICCIKRDITALKKMEELKIIAEENEKKLKEALELDRLRTEFFANLSHELRTPLNIIFSSIQLINSYITDNAHILDENGVISRNLKVSRQNCNRLLRLINNLIDVTKIDAGFYELNPINCNIVEIVEEIALSVVEYTKSRDINLVFDTDTEEKIIACDPDIIERIMLNLLSNAIKFSHNSGSIFISISDGPEYVSIFVEDTGIGIPEDKLLYVFERFTQVDNLLTRTNEGSGIGLSLVKSLVEMHGGTISIQSNYGKGTKLTIKLPVKVLYHDGKNIVINRNNIINNPLEKINIEFSDIYL